jgi:hypothetical protein
MGSSYQLCYVGLLKAHKDNSTGMLSGTGVSRNW